MVDIFVVHRVVNEFFNDTGVLAFALKVLSQQNQLKLYLPICLVHVDGGLDMH